MPGPVFAVTVVKGYENKNAGLYIALGHGIIEFPLMLLIFFGFASFFTSGLMRFLVGLVGGVMLIYMGVGMLRLKLKNFNGKEKVYHNSLVAGALTTAANPYFFLWWATIGFTLIVNATIFGIKGFIIFMVAHWLCDLSWYMLISLSIFKSKRILNMKKGKWILNLCALTLILFGLWFILSTIT